MQTRILQQLRSNLFSWLVTDNGNFDQVALPVDGFSGVGDAVGWWLQHRLEHQGIVRVATFILCAPVQSASCERMFKTITFFHSKVRNRLSGEKYMKMTRVKHFLGKKKGSTFTQKNRIEGAEELDRINGVEDSDDESDDVGGQIEI
jgi:hypothetical protein